MNRAVADMPQHGRRVSPMTEVSRCVVTNDEPGVAPKCFLALLANLTGFDRRALPLSLR